MFQITGILKVKNSEVQVSERFKKREFVLTTEPGSQYPQSVQFQLAQDKCSLINDYNIGEEIKVHFNLRGREWVKEGQEVKYFNTLDAWRIERVGTSNNSSNQNTQHTQQNNTIETHSTPVMNNGTGCGNDDLPF